MLVLMLVGWSGWSGWFDEKTNLSVDSAFCQLVQTKVEPGMPSRVNLVVVIMIMVAMVALVIILIMVTRHAQLPSRVNKGKTFTIGWFSSSSSILKSLPMFTSLGTAFVQCSRPKKSRNALGFGADNNNSNDKNNNNKKYSTRGPLGPTRRL